MVPQTVCVEFAFENTPSSEGKSGVVAQGDAGMYITYIWLCFISIYLNRNPNFKNLQRR